jgi:hypothetical protein
MIACEFIAPAHTVFFNHSKTPSRLLSAFTFTDQFLSWIKCVYGKKEKNLDCRVYV